MKQINKQKLLEQMVYLVIWLTVISVPLVGDYLFVSKLSYGPRVPQTPLHMPLAQHPLARYIRLVGRPYGWHGC